jgi:hypothetical protein
MQLASGAQQTTPAGRQVKPAERFREWAAIVAIAATTITVHIPSLQDVMVGNNAYT